MSKVVLPPFKSSESMSDKEIKNECFQDCDDDSYEQYGLQKVNETLGTETAAAKAVKTEDEEDALDGYKQTKEYKTTLIEAVEAI